LFISSVKTQASVKAAAGGGKTDPFLLSARFLHCFLCPSGTYAFLSSNVHFSHLPFQLYTYFVAIKNLCQSPSNDRGQHIKKIVSYPFTVQALASQGGEITLVNALFST
jgi:hypothetical protein